MYTTIDYELDLARDFHGNPLDDETRTLIKLYLHDPSVALWNELFGRIIMSDGNLRVNFWQAVTIVDPTFQKRREKVAPGCYEPWDRCPSAEALLEALKYATH